MYIYFVCVCIQTDMSIQLRHHDLHKPESMEKQCGNKMAELPHQGVSKERWPNWKPCGKEKTTL